jgi:hypothetical protein
MSEMCTNGELVTPRLANLPSASVPRESFRMPAPAFRRDRQCGLTDASIKRAIRAARAEAPDAIVEVDPINQKIRITNVGSAALAANEITTQANADEALKEWQKKHADKAEGPALDDEATR